MFRYVIYPEQEIFGKRWSFNVCVPVGSVKLDGEVLGGNDMSSTGMGDVVFVTNIWPYSNYENQTHLGITLYVSPPVGEYSNQELLNMGSNTWKGKVEVGFDKGFGKFNIGWYNYLEFSQDNDDPFYGYTLQALDGDQERDVVYWSELHLTYDVRDFLTVGFDYNYEKGGEASINGIVVEAEMETHTIGGTIAAMFSQNTQLAIRYMQDIDVENGSKDSSIDLRLGIFF